MLAAMRPSQVATPVSLFPKAAIHRTDILHYTGLSHVKATMAFDAEEYDQVKWDEKDDDCRNIGRQPAR